jgi:hypothetical protein
MRAILTALVLALAAPAAQAQLGDLFRSLSGALRGREQPPPPQQGVTPTLGVRGIDEVDAKNAAPAANKDYNLMEGWTATRPEAERVATGKGLAARPATLRKDDAPAPATEGGMR